MKIPAILLVLILSERPLVGAEDQEETFPRSASDGTLSDARTTTTAPPAAASAATGAEDDDDEHDGGGSGERLERRRHRTRMVLPLASASSKGDQDHPIHHHRFQLHQPHVRNQDPRGSDDDQRTASVSSFKRPEATDGEVTEERETADEAGEREQGEDASASPEASETVSEPEQRAGQEANPASGASASPTSTMGGTKDAKRLWGAGAASSPSLTGGVPADSSVSAGTGSTGDHLPGGGSYDEPNKTRAFVVPKGKLAGKGPPDGYALSARVYIDPHDKLAHFDSTVQQVPFWDCGHSGSTTSSLPLKSAYFRHSLTGATSWSGTDGKHAVLVVALSPMAMDLNSGESREFGAGSVILLEDVLIAGHRMRPLGSTKEGVSVLFLTLPQQFAHAGRDHISLPASFLKPARRDDPCPNEHPLDDDARGAGFGASNDTVVSSKNEVSVGGPPSDPLATMEELGPSNSGLSHWTPRRVRRGLLTIFGLSLSSLAADFLAKTAPLWLAVGVGGTCFVAACTWTMTAGGDALWMAVELQLERRKLGATSGDASLVLEDDGEPADRLQ
jgi:hypothetical protein